MVGIASLHPPYAPIDRLFPRRLLFAAVRFQPERAAGEACGVVESVKAASDIYAPVSGTVTARNDELGDRPEKVNADAYGAWMYRLKPDNPADLASLLDVAAYEKTAAED